MKLHEKFNTDRFKSTLQDMDKICLIEIIDLLLKVKILEIITKTTTNEKIKKEYDDLNKSLTQILKLKTTLINDINVDRENITTSYLNQIK